MNGVVCDFRESNQKKDKATCSRPCPFLAIMSFAKSALFQKVTNSPCAIGYTQKIEAHILRHNHLTILAFQILLLFLICMHEQHSAL